MSIHCNQVSTANVDNQSAFWNTLFLQELHKWKGILGMIRLGVSTQFDVDDENGNKKKNLKKWTNIEKRKEKTRS